MIDDMEEARKLIDPHFAESTKGWENLGGEFARVKEIRARKIEQVSSEIARIRAEAKAEVLMAAAELAVYWMHQEYPKQDDPVRQQAIDDSLRAAILADEPNKEE